MAALHSVATLSEVTFLGEVAPEIVDWLENSTLTARLRRGYRSAAGFERR